jgi:hypothetical protein
MNTDMNMNSFINAKYLGQAKVEEPVFFQSSVNTTNWIKAQQSVVTSPTSDSRATTNISIKTNVPAPSAMDMLINLRRNSQLSELSFSSSRTPSLSYSSASRSPSVVSSPMTAINDNVSYDFPPGSLLPSSLGLNEEQMAKQKGFTNYDIDSQYTDNIELSLKRSFSTSSTSSHWSSSAFTNTNGCSPILSTAQSNGFFKPSLERTMSTPSYLLQQGTSTLNVPFCTEPGTFSSSPVSVSPVLSSSVRMSPQPLSQRPMMMRRFSDFSRLSLEDNDFEPLQEQSKINTKLPITRQPIFPGIQQQDQTVLPPRLTIPSFVTKNRRPSVTEENVNKIHLHLKTPSAPLNKSQYYASVVESVSEETNSSNKKPNLYKTELCRTWEETGACRYNSKCQFAHGAAELRAIERHPKYKTQMCRTFWEKGTCPYGKRCCFLHSSSQSQVVNEETVVSSASTLNFPLHRSGSESSNDLKTKGNQSIWA